MTDKASAAGETTGRTFEEALKALESHVQSLDGGDLPLEDALRCFEEGVALVRECNEKLDSAERRMVELTESARGEIEEEPFTP